MAEALESVSPLVKRIANLNRHLSQDFLGGPRPFKMAWVINAQKATTIIFVAGLMLAYEERLDRGLGIPRAPRYVRTLLAPQAPRLPRPELGGARHHGGAVMTWVLVLGLYWVIAFLVVSDVLGPRPEPPPAMLAVAIGVHTLGVALMTAADAQKYFTLRVHPRLIEDGLYRLAHHPNYLGEMMIYGAYALLARHWFAWAILAWIWLEVFLVNMKAIDASLSRHPGWTAYKAKTGMILPRLRAPAQGRRSRERRCTEARRKAPFVVPLPAQPWSPSATTRARHGICRSTLRAMAPMWSARCAPWSAKQMVMEQHLGCLVTLSGTWAGRDRPWAVPWPLLRHPGPDRWPLAPGHGAARLAAITEVRSATRFCHWQGPDICREAGARAASPSSRACCSGQLPRRSSRSHPRRRQPAAEPLPGGRAGESAASADGGCRGRRPKAEAKLGPDQLEALTAPMASTRTRS